jgi:hypothetical protein
MADVFKQAALVAQGQIDEVVQVGHQNVEVAVPVEVFGRGAHARDGQPVGAEGTAAQSGVLLECAVSAVDPQQAGRLVGGHEDIDALVAREVRAHQAQAMAGDAGNP